MNMCSNDVVVVVVAVRKARQGGEGATCGSSEQESRVRAFRRVSAQGDVTWQSPGKRVNRQTTVYN